MISEVGNGPLSGHDCLDEEAKPAAITNNSGVVACLDPFVYLLH